jgi:hypothetical protein
MKNSMEDVLRNISATEGEHISVERRAGLILSKDSHIYEKISSLGLDLSNVHEALRDIEYVIGDTDFISVKILQMAVRAGGLRKAFTAIAQDVEDLADRVSAETRGIFLSLVEISKLRDSIEKNFWNIRRIPSEIRSLFTRFGTSLEKVKKDVAQINDNIQSMLFMPSKLPAVDFENPKSLLANFSEVIPNISKDLAELGNSTNVLKEVIAEAERLNEHLKELLSDIDSGYSKISEYIWGRMDRREIVTPESELFTLSTMFPRLKNIVLKSKELLENMKYEIEKLKTELRER